MIRITLFEMEIDNREGFFSKLLTGMSIGIVVALIPNALLGEILKLIIPHFPPLQHLFDITFFVMSLLPVLIGVMVGVTFKLSPIQTASVGIAAMVGSGAVKKRPTVYSFLMV